MPLPPCPRHPPRTLICLWVPTVDLWGPSWPDYVLWVSFTVSWATVKRGHGWRRAPGHCHSPPDGVTVAGRLRRAGGVSQGSTSGSCCVGRGVGVGGWWVTDMDKGLIVVKALKNKRERGETPPKAQGLKPPKAQGWWESSTRGPPGGQESSVGPWGKGEEPREGLPALQTSTAPSSFLAAQSLSRPPGRYWLQAST